jgi:glycosyltransferase involved in cell wall biosynthesis
MAKRIFGAWSAWDLSEWYAVLSPRKIDTILLRKPAKLFGKSGIYSQEKFKNINVVFTIPYSQKKYPRSAYIDFFIYCLFFLAFLPFLLIFYNTFIFICPPFFETLATPILRVFRKKIVVVSIDDWVAHGEYYRGKIQIFRKIKLRFGRWLEILAVKNATQVFAVSQRLVNLYKPHNKNVFHAPNGADVEKIDSIHGERMFDKPTIVYLGGIETWRGIDLLIDAFRLVRKEKKGKLLIMGGGIAFEEMKKYAGDDPDIKFTGYIDHDTAMSYIKGSEVAVMPNRKCLVSQAISSIKCFEYVACETPAVVTNSGEHAYWTKKYGTGIVVEDTPEIIANGILTLLSNKELYGSLKENCRKYKQDVDFKKTREIYVKKLLT